MFQSLKFGKTKTKLFNKLHFVKIVKFSIRLYFTIKGYPCEAIIISQNDIISVYPEFKNINKELLMNKLKEEKKIAKFLIPKELMELSYFLSSIGFDVKSISIEEIYWL